MNPRKGTRYRFFHKRKGEVLGKMLGRQDGDEADKKLWLVDLDASGERLLRPSLITKVVKADG